MRYEHMAGHYDLADAATQMANKFKGNAHVGLRSLNFAAPPPQAIP